MGNYLIGKRTAAPDNIQQEKTICNSREIKFEDLPYDVLPLKEVVRTSVLSSEWRYLWVHCPKLCFNSAELSGRERCIKKFIDNVNTVLHKCHGEVVEELKVKFGFDSMLAHHVDNWISFAASSRIKVLGLDLEAIDSWLRNDHYIFPFQLLNNESISCLQSIQLSFVSLKPPFQFGGFPNLRKLHLSMVPVTRKDLQDTLSSCCKIECLSMDRCHLGDELKVDTPLFHLLHLRIVRCELTNIEFHAVNLHTFEYRGPLRPIVLNNSRKLNDGAPPWRGSGARGTTSLSTTTTGDEGAGPEEEGEEGLAPVDPEHGTGPRIPLAAGPQSRRQRGCLVESRPRVTEGGVEDVGRGELAKAMPAALVKGGTTFLLRPAKGGIHGTRGTGTGKRAQDGGERARQRQDTGKRNQERRHGRARDIGTKDQKVNSTQTKVILTKTQPEVKSIEDNGKRWGRTVWSYRDPERRGAQCRRGRRHEVRADGREEVFKDEVDEELAGVRALSPGRAAAGDEEEEAARRRGNPVGEERSAEQDRQQRNLQLLMNIDRKDADKILCLASFLRATPRIEILEVHFGCPDLWFAYVGPTRQNLQRYEYTHLKSVSITGYKGARGQLEFILHVAENAPALEVLTVYTTLDMHEHAGQVTKCCLSQKRSPTLKFCVV
ncbi:hypothetical protein C2845_PM13G26030 [Panicum miliaceum]|uniref:At1g61320/AtMIF1 LRR domain-containing protein n=1 Tax=Panicum miliaceum TaxID=4540 RepID=A0A3L6RJ04_PANMI|nr:hypothetical protein C2845_PM13G26030 [Panicum miliaceum]